LPASQQCNNDGYDDGEQQNHLGPGVFSSASAASSVDERK
jgi:hypothetical protein